MRKLSLLVHALIVHAYLVPAQSSQINRQQFFLDDKVIQVTLTTDIKKLRSDKKISAWQPANIVMHFSDTSVISEVIRVQSRGEYRKANCDIAALMLNFKNPSSPVLSPLKKLKLVGGCRMGRGNEDLLLKEYLVYKIYNLLSGMSFRVKLLHINYNDSRGKTKSYSQYAFLIEDMKDISERNNCVEMKRKDFNTEGTNRQQMTLVSLFQYMIGNTDWSVPKYHNIRLMVSKNDTLSKPYAVPYDFDYAGIVDAPYAVPVEELGITSVKERLYRGFPRNMDELQSTLQIFKEKKEVILFTVNNFPLLGARVKRDITNYLEEFYEIINNKRLVKSNFIDNARRN